MKKQKSEKMTPPTQAAEHFKQSLFNKEEFTLTFELVPGRGSGGKKIERILDFAERAKKDGRIKALSITDNPGGHPALAPGALGLDIQAIGLEPLIHFSLKDKNRNMAESQLFECHRHGLVSLLVLGGDYPRYGFHGQAMPVFDLDSPQLLTLISSLRHKMILEKTVPGGGMQLPPMDFLAGCVVSPFKTTEAEQVLQYVKLEKKIAAGANFIISQLGYDMDKFQELLRFCDKSSISVPIIGNVFIPNLTVAKIMCEEKVPGVIFPHSLLQVMRHEIQQGGDKEEGRLIRGAKMLSCLKGLGYDGVHLGGNGLDFDKVSFVLDQAEQLYGNWQEHLDELSFCTPNTWYMYEATQEKSKKSFSLSFSLGKLVHDLLFTDGGVFYGLFRRFSLFCSSKTTLYRLYSAVEHLTKKILFRCRMCGDCTLAESAYLCPQSGCPKRMINGPCGGSINGYCEVYPGQKRCFWVKVYEKLPDTEYETLKKCPLLPPKNWSLAESSSWINFYSGRDHHEIEKKRNATIREK